MDHIILTDADTGLLILIPTRGAVFESLPPMEDPPPPTAATAPRGLDEADDTYAERLAALHAVAKSAAANAAKTLVTIPIMLTSTEDCGEHVQQPMQWGVRESTLRIAAMMVAP